MIVISIPTERDRRVIMPRFAILRAFNRACDCDLLLLDSAARTARDHHHRGIAEVDSGGETGWT